MAPMVGIQHHNLAQGGCGAAAARGADGSVNWTSAATAHLGREHRPATRLGHVHGTSLPHSCNHTTQILPTDRATCTQQYTEITPDTQPPGCSPCRAATQGTYSGVITPVPKTDEGQTDPQQHKGCQGRPWGKGRRAGGVAGTLLLLEWTHSSCMCVLVQVTFKSPQMIH